MQDNPNLIKIGERVRKLRGKQSRREFAEAFLVAPSSLARWENGETAPDLGFIVRLSGAYQVDVEWIITGKDSTTKNGKATASHHLAYLDKMPLFPEEKESDASDILKRENPQHEEIIDHKEKDKSDRSDHEQHCGSRLADLMAQNELLRQNADLLRQNGDLRVQLEQFKAAACHHKEPLAAEVEHTLARLEQENRELRKQVAAFRRMGLGVPPETDAPQKELPERTWERK